MAIFRNRTSQSPKKKQSPDGFIRRESLALRSFSEQKELSTKDAIGNFKQTEGFRVRNRKKTQPDGTRLGRKPIYKKDLDLDLPGGHSRRRGVSKAKRSKRKVFKRAALSMVALTILVGGYLLGMAFLQVRSVFQGGSAQNVDMCEGIEPDQLTEENQCRINLLVLGIDDEASLTDSIIVMSIDPVDNRSKLISIPRDLYVQSPAAGQSKINAVYSLQKQASLAQGLEMKEAEKAGIEALETVIEEVLGIEINYYATVNFEAFSRAIDTVGGVTVDVQEPLYDATMAHLNNGNPLLAPAGEQTFDGYRALMYARSRFGSARGDFDRAERQRELMVALRNEVISVGTFGNPVRITQLMDNFSDNVRTNLSIDDVMKLYEVANRIDDSRVESIGLADPPNDFVTTGMIGDQSVVMPRSGLYQYREIQEYVKSVLVDGFVMREQPRVAILNGTNITGLATQYEKQLSLLGYDVVEVDDAPTKDYQQSKFFNISEEEKPFTARFMELRFKTNQETSLPAGIEIEGVDFVIILGRNEAVSN